MKIIVTIVEDEKTYSNTLKKVINHQQDLICDEQFYSGKEALKGLKESKPDVVLMDIQLQDMLGTDVVRILKPLLPETKFIMCTTYEDDNIIYEAFKNGASGYLLKDFVQRNCRSKVYKYRYCKKAYR